MMFIFSFERTETFLDKIAIPRSAPGHCCRGSSPLSIRFHEKLAVMKNFVNQSCFPMIYVRDNRNISTFSISNFMGANVHFLNRVDWFLKQIPTLFLQYENI